MASDAHSFAVVANADGVPVPKELLPGDACTLAGATSFNGRAFPPEFDYDPGSGEPLPVSPPPALAWIPPYGAGPAFESNGLRLACRPLRVANPNGRSETGDPDDKVPHPPPGVYRFLSLPLTKGAAVLVAVNPGSGEMHQWAAQAKKWLPITARGEIRLSRSSLPFNGWRCVVSPDTKVGTPPLLYLPTDYGLATLRFDPLTLAVQVEYPLKGRCWGAPAFWRDRIWVILQQEGAQGACLQSLCPATGKIGNSTTLDVLSGQPEFYAPVHTTHWLIWPGEGGYLTLEGLAGGALEPMYRTWPDGVVPKFEFGAPYLCASGFLWQTGWSATDESYVCVRLDGSGPAEIQKLNSPRLVTGKVNYRLSTKMADAPWHEPDRVVENVSNTVFVPMVEDGSGSVFGVGLRWDDSLQGLLDSSGTHQAVLELHASDGSAIRLYGLKVHKPWQGQVFMHEGRLWFWHQGLQGIIGWDLPS